MEDSPRQPGARREAQDASSGPDMSAESPDGSNNRRDPASESSELEGSPRLDGQPALGARSARVNPEALQPNDVVGGYVILRKLGQGGFGTVYQAKDPESLAEVAIKIPKEEWDVTEVRTLEALDHPNIIRVKHIGRDDKLGLTRFIVMPYAEGGSLADRLKAGERPSIEDAVRWTAALARALSYLYGKGVCHRDLKPANILFNKSGNPLLADFGLALHANQGSLTVSSPGSRRYKSPEQHDRRGDALDVRSDIYSLGVVLYEMLVGETPFPQASNENELRRYALNIAPPPIRDRNPQVPAELERICLKMLATKPDNRHSSALDVATELEAVLSPPKNLRKAVLLFAALGLVLAGLTLVRLWTLGYFGTPTTANKKVDAVWPSYDNFIPNDLDLSKTPQVKPEEADFRIENRTGDMLIIDMQRVTRSRESNVDMLLASPDQDEEQQRVRAGVDSGTEVPPMQTVQRHELSGSGWYAFHVRRASDAKWEPYRDKQGNRIGIRNVLQSKFTRLVITKAQGDSDVEYDWEFEEGDAILH